MSADIPTTLADLTGKPASVRASYLETWLVWHKADPGRQPDADPEAWTTALLEARREMAQGRRRT